MAGAFLPWGEAGKEGIGGCGAYWDTEINFDRI